MSPARKRSCSHFYRMGWPLLALGTVAWTATITQSGYMTPMPIGNNPQTVPMFVTAFDSRSGTLNSASITYSMFATFQATIGSTPAPLPVPLPELVGFQAILSPGLVEVGGQPIGRSPLLQSPPAQTFIPSGGITTIFTASPVQYQTVSVAVPFLLSSLEVPAGGIPVPIKVMTGGVSYIPFTPQSIILNDLTMLQAPYVSVTYNYTPLAPKTMALAALTADAAEASPVPEPAFLALTGLILLALGFGRRGFQFRLRIGG